MGRLTAGRQDLRSAGHGGDVIILQDVFAFKQTGMDGRRIVGRLATLGIRPKCLERLEAHGVRLPPSLFGGSERRAAS